MNDERDVGRIMIDISSALVVDGKVRGHSL